MGEGLITQQPNESEKVRVSQVLLFDKDWFPFDVDNVSQNYQSVPWLGVGSCEEKLSFLVMVLASCIHQMNTTYHIQKFVWTSRFEKDI